MYADICNYEYDDRFACSCCFSCCFSKGANTKAAGIRTGVSGSVSLAELAAVGELDVNSGGAAADATDSGDSNGKLSASINGKKAAGSSSSSSASSSGTLLDFAVKYEAIIQVRDKKYCNPQLTIKHVLENTDGGGGGVACLGWLLPPPPNPKPHGALHPPTLPLRSLASVGLPCLFVNSCC